jgi:hypothetical protein
MAMDVAARLARGLEVGRFATLHNGAGVRLRPIRPDDAPGLLAFRGRLSRRTVYQRFFTVRRLRPEDSVALATVDRHDRLAIVTARDIGLASKLVGVARYSLGGGDTAPDVGLVVQDPGRTWDPSSHGFSRFLASPMVVSAPVNVRSRG